MRAGLEPEAYRDGKAAILLRADAAFDPFELARTLHRLHRDNIVLTDKTGLPVGYVLDGAHTYSDKLPSLRLRGACRITLHNYADILWQRQEALRRTLAETGVFFESEEVSLSPLYTIGRGTLIGRNTVLAGEGSIGENCVITDSELRNVHLGTGVCVKNSVLSDCRVEAGETVGPFVHLHSEREEKLQCAV